MPFAQINSADQLRAAVAIGCALSPELGVLLVREGSLLDRESERLLAELASERGVQVWVEAVDRDGGDLTVTITERWTDGQG